MAGGLVGWIEDGLGAAGEVLDDVFQFTMDITGLGALWDWIMPDMPEIEYPGVKLNKVGTDLPLPLVYGTRRLGGIVVFKAVDPANSGNLHMVIALAEGPIHSIGDVYLNDDPSTDAKFNGLVTITKYTGTTTQAADPDLVAVFPDYTSTAQLKGVAYLHIKLTYNRDVFRGIPVITADVTGRTGLSLYYGSQRPASNPAIALLDYLIHPGYGRGLDLGDIDQASFANAEAACDALMPAYSGGQNIKMFETNGVVNTSRPVSDNITALLAQCRGNLIYTGGKYRLEIEGTKAPSFSLNADNILSHSGVKSGGKRARLNGVKVEFINPLTDWEKDYAITSSAAMVAEDGGLVLETTVNRPFETSPYRAQYIAETIVKKSRESLTLSLVASHQAMQVEVADIVDVTHASFGWASKLFRVAAVEIRPDLTVGLALVEYEPTTYDRTIPASAFVSPPNTSLPDPSVVVPPSGVAVASGTAHLLTMGDGTVVTRAWVSWTASPDAYVDFYEVQAKQTTGAWGGVGIQGTVRVSADETGAYVYPVEDGKNYDFRVRAVNTAGARSTWAVVVAHLVLGKQEVPAIPNLVAYTTTAAGRRRLTWRMPVVTPDLAGFEIRYYPALTGGGWNAASKLVDGLVAVDPNVAPPNGDYAFEWDHLPAGDYQFYVRPWDTSGLTSINASSSGGVTLPAPPLTSADWSQVTGPGRPQDNADVTATNTAAGIAGQGALATANSADWQTQVTGAGRPQDNADVTQQVIDTGILTTGAVWMNSGTFGAKGIQAEYNNGTPRLHVGDGANSYLKHDGTLLTWKAANTELD
ncbi:MAG: fibronectin type III domain-containing protein, partial [Leptospirillia bacterium]